MNKEIMKTMKILPIDSICPFEWNSYPNEPVEFDDIHQIRHPFLVTPLSDGTYLLLEESVEYYTLVQTGIKLLPVQIIQREHVHIQQGTIGIYSFNENDLGEILSLNSGQISCQLAASELEVQDAVTMYFDEKKYSIQSIPKDSEGCSPVVLKLFEHFEQNGGYKMLRHQKSLSDSLMKIHRFKTSVEIPKVSIDDLAKAVETNRLFPPNILKVGADIRILYIDFPVSTLMADNSIIEKEVFLRELILLREQSEKTSTYEGKVYVLNR